MLKNAYLTPPQTDNKEEDLLCAFYIKYPFDWAAAEDDEERDPEVELDLMLAVELDLMLVGWAAWQEPSQTLFQLWLRTIELESAFNG